MICAAGGRQTKINRSAQRRSEASQDFTIVINRLAEAFVYGLADRQTILARSYVPLSLHSKPSLRPGRIQSHEARSPPLQHIPPLALGPARFRAYKFARTYEHAHTYLYRQSLRAGRLQTWLQNHAFPVGRELANSGHKAS